TPYSMTSRLFVALVCVLAATLPVAAQDKLYPVRPKRDLPGIPILVSSDRLSFVIEKAFQHKITIGFPSDDRMDYLPETRAQLVVFCFRIQNRSGNTLHLDPSKFTSTDDSGRMFSIVSAETATDRIMASVSGSSLGTKALRRVSLGRAGHKPTVEEVREDIVR